jgi:histidinol phosphatase-like PHP family hydrolase
MTGQVSRRDFMKAGAGVLGVAALSGNAGGEEAPPFPLVDYHVHLDNSTIDEVLPLSKERGVKFGIVEHAGTKENVYPTVLGNDAELEAYLAMLDGKGVYRGVQAEWTDWMGCFSKEALAKLDYVLTDTMTFPGKDGRRMKLWEDTADYGTPDQFMDRYVDWHVRIIETEPIDILVNVSWLPGAMAGEYDAWWTDRRIGRVIEAAAKQRVAIEISSSFKLPGMRFLEAAKSAGLKFCFGSNGRYPKMGLLDWSLETAKTLRLTAEDMFAPAPDGQKAAQRKL